MKNNSQIHSNKEKRKRITQNSKVQPLKAFVFPQIQELVNNYSKQMEKPCSFYQSVFESQTSQRCLIHNNVLSLYCHNDNKPLCVTCMYQSSIHKKHRVIPLNRAQAQMDADIKKNIKIGQNCLTLTDELIKKGKYNIERVQKQFPQIIERIADFYQQITDLLAQKKTEHIQHVQQTWSKYRYEYSSYINEFSKINIQIVQKLKEVNKHTTEGDDEITYCHNVTNHFFKIQKLLQSQSCEYHEINYLEELKKFLEVKNLLKNKIIFTNVHPQKQNKTKDIVVSPAKSQKGVKLSDKMNKKILLHAKIFNSPVGLVKQIQSQSLKTTPKNRHSSEVIETRQNVKKSLQKFKKSMNIKNSKSRNQTLNAQIKQTPSIANK